MKKLKYNDAKKLVKELGIKTPEQYLQMANDGTLDKRLPLDPELFYSKHKKEILLIRRIMSSRFPWEK